MLPAGEPGPTIRGSSSNFMRMLRAPILLLPALLLGCGYHTPQSSEHLPPSITSIDVPIFKTNVTNYNTEVAFTRAVVQELTTRTKDRITESDKPHAADAVLRGTILTETYTPLTFNSETGQSSSYLIAITAAVTLTAADGTVLYKNDHFLYRAQYQATADLATFIQEDSPAVQRMAHEFAADLVNEMLEGF